MSWDLSVPVTHLYINDVSDKTDDVGPTDDTIDYDSTDWAIGAFTDGNTKFNGAIADLYFAPGQFLDFSDVVNRRKFINADGTPVRLGPDGSYPTGTAPLIFFTERPMLAADELDLEPRTMSVFVDGVKGTDVQALANHTPHEQATQFYYGSMAAPVAVNRAVNYIRNLEAVQRAIPDSEILGRR